MLPNIFQGCLPSLRELSLATAVTWSAGLFKDLHSFEFDTNPEDPIPPGHVLEVLRESPLLENLHLVGHCALPDDEPPTVALPSLRNCTLIGNGAISLIWYMRIPASSNMFLSTPPHPGVTTGIYPFRDLCLAPHLHVLDGVTTASFFIEFDTIKLRTRNDSGGVLDVRVYYHENVMAGLISFVTLFNNPFFESPCRIQTAKEFALHIERGASRDDTESVNCAVIFLKFVSDIPSIEHVELRGVPTKALSLFLRLLHKNPTLTVPSPNLRRLRIESTPLRSPKPLLEDVDELLRGRKDLGLPMQSVDLEVRCEELITIAEHSAFLVAWSHLVGEDVGVAYSRDKVEKLPRRGLRVPSFGGENEDEDDEEPGDIEPVDGSDLDWESWTSGQWPKAASEMKGRMIPDPVGT